MSNGSALKKRIELFESDIRSTLDVDYVNIWIVDIKKAMLKRLTSKIVIPIDPDSRGIVLEAYYTKSSHLITQAWSNFLYRSEVDNPEKFHIKDIAVVPVLDEAKQVVAIIEVVSLYGSEKELSIRDVKKIESIAIALRETLSPLKHLFSEADTTQSGASNTMHALVVDESMIIVKLLQSVLALHHVYAFEANFAREALKLFVSHKIDLVFVGDIHSGESAEWLIQNIRNLNQHSGNAQVPILGLTSEKDDQEKKRRLLRAGANRILYKPINVKDISQVVRDFVMWD